MAGSHDSIIAQAGKAALGPLGFSRKGRSRTWLADNGWWLRVVEFQPSTWGKGSYLNVAAHWLWSATGNLSFDFGGRVSQFAEYVSEEQFANAASNLATQSAAEAQLLALTFPSLEATANILACEERRLQQHERFGWMGYHAGVAAGLVGRQDDADEIFTRIADSPASPRSMLHSAAKRMKQLVREPTDFRHEVALLIHHQREALNLPILSTLPF